MSWKFYGRSLELEACAKLVTQPRWFFCAISGRRRIGKTSLIRQTLQSLPHAPQTIYLQVPDSDERDVVAVFADALHAAQPVSYTHLTLPTILRV